MKKRSLAGVLIFAIVLSMMTSLYVGNFAIVSASSVSNDADFLYTENGDETINIYEYVGAAKEVTVPAQIDGKDVYAVESDTFLGNEYVEKIVFSNGIKKIWDYAVDGCDNILSITIPESVTYVNTNIANYTPLLESITVDENNANYSSIDGVLFNKDKTTLMNYPSGKKDTEYVVPDSVNYIHSGAFERVGALTKVTLPSGVDTIYENTFCESTALENIILPNTLTMIEYGSFYGCAIKSIDIPASVTDMTASSFEGCNLLESVNVDEANTVYTSVDGVLFTKDKKELLLYPIGKSGGEYIVPEGVEIIGSYAFSNLPELYSVSLPDSLKMISLYAFNYCPLLKYVIIPANIEGIEEYGISGETELLHIYYKGSETEWSEISIDSSQSYTWSDAVIHYDVAEQTLYTAEVAEKPTCYKSGVEKYTCLLCAEDVTEKVWNKDVMPLGHNVVEDKCERCLTPADDCIESEHPYGANIDKSWTISRPGAEKISLTFSESTRTEDDFDKIMIYDAQDNLLGTFSGGSLAGTRLTVKGDKVIIRFTSDGSINYFGFMVEKIKVVYPEVVPTFEPTMEPTAATTGMPTPELTSEPAVRPTVEPTSASTVTPAILPNATPTVEQDVTPKPPIKKVLKFVKKKITIKRGKKKVLKVKLTGAKKAKFTTNKKKIAKIVKKKAKKVTIKGVKKGKAVITAKAVGKKARCKVTVK